jgi:hypothetical protein
VRAALRGLSPARYLRPPGIAGSPAPGLARTNGGYGSGHEEGATAVRALRAITVVVAVLTMAALVGGCGGGSSKPSLAAQDQLVGLSNQLAVIHSQYAATQRRLARARRAVARVRSTTLVATRSSSSVTVTAVGDVKRSPRPTVLSADTLCTPIRPRASTGPQRRAQQLLERRRRRALYFLNLSCPPEGA